MIQFFLELPILLKVVYILLIFTFLYQLFQWLSFATLASFRGETKEGREGNLPSISVVVVVGEGATWYLEGEFEKVLTQKYNGQWEVVVVNDCGGVEINVALEDLQMRYPHLRHTELKKDARFGHSRKIPLFLGIKSAQYEHIVIADPTASPASARWLARMAEGFNCGDIVIGYTGFKLSTNGLIRSSRLMSSIRSLSSASVDRPYRGIFNNIGYTRESFFATGGFNHLRLATGEDDLFVQKLEKYYNASVVMSVGASMRQSAYGGLRWWWANQRYNNFGMCYYPFGVRFKMFMELFVKTLFFASVVLTILDSVLWGGMQWAWTVGAGALLLRELIMIWSVRRVMRRLGEKKMLWSFVLYDLINPITELLLKVSIKLKKPAGIWK